MLMHFLIGFICLLLTGCASMPTVSNVSKEMLAERIEILTSDLSSGILAPINSPAIGMFKGRLFFLRFNAGGQVVYQNFDGEPQVLSGDSPFGSNLTHILFHADSSGLIVCWRPKLTRHIEGVGRPGDKLILCRTSTDGITFSKTERLNRRGGAFMPRFASNKKGDIYAVWTDERDGGQNLDLYLNFSRDSGQTWRASDLRMDTGEPGSNPSIDPVLAVDDDNVWLAWNEAGRPATIMIRGSTDRGETWGDPVIVSQEEFSPTGLDMVKLPKHRGGRLVLYWFNQWEFKGAYSDDEGRTWTPFSPLPGFADAAELTIKQTPSGKVYLVAGILPDDKKEDLLFAVSEDGIRFSKPQRLDTNTQHLTTSTNPQIIVDGEDRVLVLWQDLRNFRYNIYYNFSADGGKTWLSEDRFISPEGGLHAYHPRAIPDGAGGFHVIWVGYTNDNRRQGSLYTWRFIPEAPWLKDDSKQPSAARLQLRVAQFWGDRLKANWGGNYDLMDPFFKQTTTREYYIATQFKTIYHDFEIKGAVISENRADVTIRYTFEIPEMLSSAGQKIRIPKRAEEITEEWIWIDGDWYRVFKDIMGGSFVPR